MICFEMCCYIVIIAMFTRETKPECENNLFLNMKELIRILIQNYFFFGNSEKFRKFSFSKKSTV